MTNKIWLNQDLIKKKYKVKGMHCANCAMVIESDLEDVGVKAKCDFAKYTLEVEFDSKKINIEKIRETVKSSGYTIT